MLSHEETLRMIEPKRKMLQLRELIPGAPNDYVYDFGEFLSMRFNNSDITPLQFVMGCKQAICDLMEGVDSISGERIESPLTGLQPWDYLLLEGEIQNIADAIFPMQFSIAVSVAFLRLLRPDGLAD